MLALAWCDATQLSSQLHALLRKPNSLYDVPIIQACNIMHSTPLVDFIYGHYGQHGSS